MESLNLLPARKNFRRYARNSWFIPAILLVQQEQRVSLRWLNFRGRGANSRPTEFSRSSDGQFIASWIYFSSGRAELCAPRNFLFLTSTLACDCFSRDNFIGLNPGKFSTREDFPPATLWLNQGRITYHGTEIARCVDVPLLSGR